MYSSSYFSLLATVVYSPSVYLYETNYPYERGHSITHSIFKTSVQQRRDHFSLFLNTKQVLKEAKMLIKLIVADSDHFKRYKSKIMDCLDSQTLSEYISMIVLDDNEKLSINEVLEVLIGVGTFTSIRSFNTQSLQFVAMMS